MTEKEGQKSEKSRWFVLRWEVWRRKCALGKVKAEGLGVPFPWAGVGDFDVKMGVVLARFARFLARDLGLCFGWLGRCSGVGGRPRLRAFWAVGKCDSLKARMRRGRGLVDEGF